MSIRKISLIFAGSVVLLAESLTTNGETGKAAAPFLDAATQFKIRFGENWDHARENEIRAFMIAQERFAKGSKVDYIADATINVRGQVLNARFFRRNEPDGFISRRTEVDAGDGRRDCYIANREGLFGVVNGRAFKLVDCFILFWADDLTYPVTQRDFGISRHTARDFRSGGRQALEITEEMRFLNDLDMRAYARGTAEMVNDRSSPIYNQYASLRKYSVDLDTGLVFAKQYYSMNGKVLYHKELKNIQFNPEFSVDCFATPENVTGNYLSEDDFAREQAAKHPQLNRPAKRPLTVSIRHWGRQVLAGTLDRGGAIFGGLALALVVSIIMLRCKRR